MGLFSRLFQPKPTPEPQKPDIIELLAQWEKIHFPKQGYTYYYTEQGEEIDLGKFWLSVKRLKSSTVLGTMKNVMKFLDKPLVSDFIAEYRDGIYKEINRYRETMEKKNRLAENWKEDFFFEQVSHVFETKLKILYNELQFCAFDQLGNAGYFDKMCERFLPLHQDIKTLNDAFSKYLYALTRTAYEDTRTDLEQIRAYVEGMSEAVQNSIF